MFPASYRHGVTVRSTSSPSEAPRRASLRLRDKPRSRALGLLIALGAVMATTAVIYPLGEITPEVSNGVLYMLAVLLVSTYWGLGLGLVTALASALAFNFFHIPPTGGFSVAEPQNYVALGVFFAAAVLASRVADLARTRADEAEGRREEADLSADLARLLLGGTDLREALTSGARRPRAGRGRLTTPSTASDLGKPMWRNHAEGEPFGSHSQRVTGRPEPRNERGVRRPLVLRHRSLSRQLHSV